MLSGCENNRGPEGKVMAATVGIVVSVVLWTGTLHSYRVPGM